jgi:YidC/Oxa1 family membrane protein insertase
MVLFYANVLQPLINVFDKVLVFIHDHVVGGSWGLAIVGLTVLVRALLLPLTLKQVKSMQSLQRLQPEIKALQAKHKDDKQRLNQEMMAFYRDNKVNPFGSCLPLVAQFPVFISLFYLLRQDLKKHICEPVMKAAAKTVSQLPANGGFPVHYANGHSCSQAAHAVRGSSNSGFLFIPDITDHAVGAVLIVLIVLYIGSQLASGLLMSVTADRNQRMMMIGLPIVFTLFIINFPAGLIVYWITTNLWTIVQQYIVRRRHPPLPRPPAAPGEPTGFRKMLEDLRGASGDGGGNGRAEKAPKRREPALAGGAPGAAAGGQKRPSGPPPRSPRKKKKRSGRRR